MSAIRLDGMKPPLQKQPDRLIDFFAPSQGESRKCRNSRERLRFFESGRAASESFQPSTGYGRIVDIRN
jgi:hypothetical protein